MDVVVVVGFKSVLCWKSAETVKLLIESVVVLKAVLILLLIIGIAPNNKEFWLAFVSFVLFEVKTNAVEVV